MDRNTPLGTLWPLGERESLADSAYREIHQAIMDGHLPPGSRLSVPELAAQLGVSRSPIREAILRLEREGLATSSHNRGAVVATPSGQDLRDLYDVREMMEGLVARRAAERATDAERAALEDLWQTHERAVASGDLQRHMTTDLEFHRRLREAGRNSRASAVLDRLTDQIRLALYATASHPGNPEQALREHRAVLEAVLDRDADRAERAARDHVARIKRSLPPVGDALAEKEAVGE